VEGEGGGNEEHLPGSAKSMVSRGVLMMGFVVNRFGSFFSV